MVANWNTHKRSLIVGLLGAALLIGAPSKSPADQGKWWNPGPGQSGKSKQAREARRAAAPHSKKVAVAPRVYRPAGRGYVVAPRYAAPAARGYAYGRRAWRPYGGYRVYRDVATVRAGYYGGGYYVGGYYGPGYWYGGGPVYRYYVVPTYYNPARICYVQPVRFYLSAGVTACGVGVYGGYANPGTFYGCNFCPAQFGAYSAYSAHVGACSAAPDGYRVVAQDRNDDWHGDQGHWEHDYDHD